MLRCVRADGSLTWQKQTDRHAAFFALHDLTHFAVETTLGYARGFFGLIAEGWDFEDTGGKGARGPLPPEAIRNCRRTRERLEISKLRWLARNMRSHSPNGRSSSALTIGSCSVQWQPHIGPLVPPKNLPPIRKRPWQALPPRWNCFVSWRRTIREMSRAAGNYSVLPGCWRRA